MLPEAACRGMTAASGAAAACSAGPVCRRLPAAPRRHLRRCRAAPSEQQQQVAVEGPLDVLRKDVAYLEERTGLDLHTPLGTVKSVHDDVVAVLNPIAGEQMARELESQIAGLQQELAVAHSQIHRNEDRLESSVASLSQLQEAVRQAHPELPPQPPSHPAAAALAAARPPAAAARAAELAAAAPPTPAAAAQPALERLAERRQQRRAGLDSSLQLPEAMRGYWFPADFSSKLDANTMVPLELFGEAWVLFRDKNGAAACVKDQCAHRACPLSLGSVVDGHIQCPYHGWEYNREGSCTKMPSTAFCKGVTVDALPVVEADGLVWIWPGSQEAITAGPPAAARPPSGFQVHAEIVMEVPVEHGLLLENLLDLAHAPFTHTSTFAKGWPIPDVVRFNAAQLLGGNWEPYPIDMEFAPPCMVLSTIGLTSPGKIERGARAASCKHHLHQLHVCLPSSEGKTRLLYRMSLDWMHWTRLVPGIQHFWRSIASQVLGEDLVLVQGQQERMAQGADVWANPMPYDKLGVRYRRWRNSVASGDAVARQHAERDLRQMSAGELFSVDVQESQDEDDL